MIPGTQQSRLILPLTHQKGALGPDFSAGCSHNSQPLRSHHLVRRHLPHQLLNAVTCYLKFVSKLPPRARVLESHGFGIQQGVDFEEYYVPSNPRVWLLVVFL